MKDHPGSSDGRTPDVCWKLIKDRDGKPVLSPNYGPDVPDSGCPVRDQSLGKTVTEAHTSRNGTRLNQVGRNRFRQPRQPSVRGVGVTCSDPTREKRGRSLVAEPTTVTNAMDSTIPARYNTLNNVSIDGDWHRVMTKNRYVKPIGTQDSRTVVSEMDDFETNRTKQTFVADRCTDPVYTVRLDGGTAKALAAGGLRSDNTNDSHVRCLNCHKKKRNYGTVRISGHVRKLLSGRLRPLSGRSPPIVKQSPPIVKRMIPSEDMEPMHYQWILRESITKTDRTVPCNYLEIPDQKIPRVFLHLAEEAREVVVINESSGFSEGVKSRATRLSSPPLVEVITNGHQMPFGRESVNDVVRPGLATHGRQTASAESGGLDPSLHERKDLSDEHGSVILLGSVMDGNETNPVIRASRDVPWMGRNELVDRSCPVDTQVMSEPSGRFEHRTDWIDDTVVGPVGLEGYLGEPDIVSHRHDSTGSGHRIDRPVFTEKRVYTHTGPLGFEVILAADRCRTNWPDPVGQSGETEQSVFPSPKADQEGCIPTDSVHPGVMMFPTQPGTDGSVGPDGARRSVGHVRPFPVHDDDRQKVGGPVGRFPYSDLLQTSYRSVLDKGRRDEAEGRQSLYVPFTDVPRTTGHRDDRTGEVDYDSTTQTRSKLGCVTGVWDPVIQKDNGFQTVRVNASSDNGLTNSRDVSRSSDSGVHSWTEQWENMSVNSMDSSYHDTVDLHRSISDEMSRLMFGAPPNTEDEGDSDYPGTDGSLTEMLDRCPSEAMSDRDRDMTYSEMTDSDSDSNSDIAVLSDFSDDSSILGVRTVLRRRVPYRGRGYLPTKGCAPSPRTPPVKARNRAEELLFEKDSTRSVWTRWPYGSLPDCTAESFVRIVRNFTNMRLVKDADPRLDRYYPKLIQSLARAGRVVMKMRHCRENHRLRRDLMLRLFDEEMEKMDLVSARFPDRHVRKFVDRPAAPPLPIEVLGTYTPPIQRKRGRKYVGLREYESDVEDYFACEEEETFWIDRAVKWYQPCV